MKTQALPPMFLLALGLSNAYALPDPSKNTALLEKTVSMKGIGPIMRDSDDDKIIYVKPTDLQVIGEFYQTSRGIDCKNLHEFGKKVYDIISDPKEIKKAIDENTYVSAMFQAEVANRTRFLTISSKIQNLRLETEQMKKDNIELYSEYTAAYQEKEIAKEEYTQADTKYGTVRSLMMKELTTATSEADRAIIKANYEEEMKESLANLKNAAINRDAANKRYIAALKGWGPYKETLSEIKKLETDLMDSLEKLTKKSKQEFEDSQDLHNTLQKKVVGKATAGYSISTNERVNLLQERIKEAGLDYSVRPLEVFNVKLNPSIMKIDAEVKDQFNDAYKLVGYEVDSKTQITLGTKKRMMKFKGTTVEQAGETTQELEHEVTEFDNSVGAAQAFEMAVTIGGYCGEPTIVEKKIPLTNAEGQTTVTTIKYPVFTPPGDKVLYAQNVPLTYNYYEQAQPIKGHCRLDISQTSDYVRDHGKKKSGGFFSRKTKSWDNTKHDYDKDMGMNCELTQKPIGSSPEESALINSAMEKSLYQDMYSMFLASYAKDFKIIPLSPTELGEDSKFFDKIGTGVMNLCGQNKYCEFGSVVLKSMDDLVGSRHSGKSSSKQTITGTIKKDFALTGYLVSEGSANVQLKVCAESSACKKAE